MLIEQDARRFIQEAIDVEREVADFVARAAAFVDVTVGSGGSSSAPTPFSYDPPCVTSVFPNAPDATGAILTFVGANFGETSAAAGEVEIYVDGAPCGAVTAKVPGDVCS